MPKPNRIRLTAAMPQLLIAGALAAAFLGLGARAAIAPDDPPSSVAASATIHHQNGVTSPPTSVASVDAPIYRAPAGMVSVLDTDGNVVGYVREDGALHPSGLVQVGARKLRGQTVVDDQGRPTGYLLGEIGFVPIEQARTPDVLDELLRQAAERRDRFAAEPDDGAALPND